MRIDYSSRCAGLYAELACAICAPISVRQRGVALNVTFIESEHRIGLCEHLRLRRCEIIEKLTLAMESLRK